jgi:hypothetical protein
MHICLPSIAKRDIDKYPTPSKYVIEVHQYTEISYINGLNEWSKAALPLAYEATQTCEPPFSGNFYCCFCVKSWKGISHMLHQQQPVVRHQGVHQQVQLGLDKVERRPKGNQAAANTFLGTLTT